MSARPSSASKRSFLGGLLAASVVLGSFWMACSSSDDNPAPSNEFGHDGGAGAAGAGGSAAGSAGTGGGSPDASVAGGGNGGLGGGGGSAGDSGIADVHIDYDPTTCTTDAGCWSCPPVTKDQFLNHCTNSECSSFDNEARLDPTLYNHGNLPAPP